MMKTLCLVIVLLSLLSSSIAQTVAGSGDASQSPGDLSTSSTTTLLVLTTKTVGSVPSNTPQPSSAISTQPTPSNVTDADPSHFRRLLFTYIVVGVILALILVIVALLAAMCILCERHIRNKKERTKRQKIALQAQKKEVEKKESSPKHKTVKPEDTGSMTDFPLLCKVLEDYDSTKHVARIKRYDSCDLEISSKTTVSYLSSGSPDCEVLEQLIDSLKQEAGEKEMTPEVIVPQYEETVEVEEEDTPSATAAALETKEDKRARMLDKFGYRLVDIEAISHKKKERMKKEGMQHSQSADNIFDDPTYSSILANRERQRMGSIPEYPASGYTTEYSAKPSDASQEEIEAAALSKSQSAADITAFDKKQHKMYMSLQNVMDIIDTKLPTDPSSASQDTDVLYGPRVVPPPNHEML